MKLSKKMQEELKSVIEDACVQGTTFPLEHESGPFKHKIATEKDGSGHLISTIEHEGKDYLIYLIK